MKKRLVILPLFVFFSLASFAQLNKNANLSSDSMFKELPRKVFTQFMQGGVKPTSFTSSYTKEKKTFLKDTEKLNTPAVMAKHISALAGYIKPEMFKSNFNVPELVSRATAAKTMSTVVSMLKDLETGLKPEALTSMWGFQRNGWLAELDKLK